jgi:hypothetical protein
LPIVLAPFRMAGSKVIRAAKLSQQPNFFEEMIRTHCLVRTHPVCVPPVRVQAERAGTADTRKKRITPAPRAFSMNFL